VVAAWAARAAAASPAVIDNFVTLHSL